MFSKSGAFLKLGKGPRSMTKRQPGFMQSMKEWQDRFVPTAKKIEWFLFLVFLAGLIWLSLK
jgi:hypothetical protein